MMRATYIAQFLINYDKEQQVNIYNLEVENLISAWFLTYARYTQVRCTIHESNKLNYQFRETIFLLHCSYESTREK